MWNDEIAKVVCIAQGFDPEHLGHRLEGKQVWSSWHIFRHDQKVRCTTGKEKSLGECDHRTYKDETECNEYTGAGVTCIDSSTLNLSSDGNITTEWSVSGSVMANCFE